MVEIRDGLDQLATRRSGSPWRRRLRGDRPVRVPVSPWAWTGFTGNTLWDWLHLLLLPLLLPVVVVPALIPRAKARMVPVDGGAPVG